MAKDKNEALARQSTEKGFTEVSQEEGALFSFDPGEFHLLGFSEEKTIKIGDPMLGGVPAYIGLLIGPAGDVSVATPDGEVGTMHSWALHPINTQTFEPNLKVTHRVIAPYQLHEFFSRVNVQAEKDNKQVICGAIFQGKKSIQGGRRQINDFRHFEKYTNPGETLKPSAPVVG